MSVWPAGARAPIGVVGTRLWEQGPDPVIVEAQERGRAYGRRLAELDARHRDLIAELVDALTDIRALHANQPDSEQRAAGAASCDWSSHTHDVADAAIAKAATRTPMSAEDCAAATGVDVETVRRVLTHVFRDNR